MTTDLFYLQPSDTWLRPVGHTVKPERIKTNKKILQNAFGYTEHLWRYVQKVCFSPCQGDMFIEKRQ